MEDLNIRTRLLLGRTACEKLAGSHAAVFGLGGVGSFAAETLARSGLGKLTLVDFSTVRISNLNRQIYALRSTIGQSKAETAGRRVKDINPACDVIVRTEFVNDSNLESFFKERPDILIDAIDGLSAKASLLKMSVECHVPVISCLGAGAKIDPSKIQVADISMTEICPLARQLRKRLHRFGISTGISCVYSSEHPMVSSSEDIEIARKADPGEEGKGRVRRPIGTISWIPGIMGMTAAGIAVRMLIEQSSR